MTYHANARESFMTARRRQRGLAHVHVAAYERRRAEREKRGRTADDLMAFNATMRRVGESFAKAQDAMLVAALAEAEKRRPWWRRWLP